MRLRLNGSKSLNKVINFMNIERLTAERLMPKGHCLNYICIFAKPPIAGCTKSRLAIDIGDDLAAELSAAMLYDISMEASNVGDARVGIFYPPGYSKNDFTLLDEFNFEYVEQCGHDLGERMENAFEFLFDKRDAERVLIIGSDCISHTSEVLNGTLSLLEISDLIIQPADDGGYTLVGQSKNVVKVFDDIPWGSDQVMNVTREIAKNLPIDFCELPESFDIDTADDLAKLRKLLSNSTTKRCSLVLDKIEQSGGLR